jgi:hypothetical protein
MADTLISTFEAFGQEGKVRGREWKKFRKRPMAELLRLPEFWAQAVESELIPEPFLSALLSEHEVRLAAAEGIILRVPKHD